MAEQNDRMSSEPKKYQHFQAGLSPLAKTRIYQLYLSGWTIRDISRRFGILPTRTKFVIWARARLFDEAVPKYGPKFFLQSMLKEIEIAKKFGTIDYGLDIPIMNSESERQSIKSWNSNYVDAQRKPEEYTDALRKLEKHQKT